MNVCIFCSSKLNFTADLIDESRSFGEWMGAQKMGLVYGGSKSGLMGVMADSVLKTGGHVIGYLPKGLFPSEIPHRGIQKLEEVSDLFERKKMMMKDGDVFVVLPGGVGTLDEFFEVITWKSLHCFDKPIYLLNVNGFWNSLMAMMRDLESKKMLDANLLESFTVVDSFASLQERLC
ncbi:MAG: TIGR00730 family Rossman fold protein [Bdellovibrionaceae bacterium]|nr:TIGR00730 family Rossman fold protein [Pseudobdellovibrionaceae bacterium]